MVNANRRKELPNVLPKGNPLPPQIDYYVYRELYCSLHPFTGEGWGGGSTCILKTQNRYVVTTAATATYGTAAAATAATTA